MKNPKVGERVKVYAGIADFTDVIKEVKEDFLLIGNFGWFSRRQCVRIVPKNRMEFWIPKEWNSENIAMLREQGNEWLMIAPPDNGSRSRYIRVREVKP